MKMTEYLLGDVCSRLSSGKSIKSSQVFEKGRFPVFGGNGIRGYTDTFNFSGECAIVGRQGAYCGNVQFYKGCAYMTEHAVVVCGNQKSNTKFLGLVLQKMNLGRLSHQAAQPGLSVKILAAQKIKLPAIETQTKIAQILTAYDDLIETNQKQIKLLEEAAQRLYKEWFVDLRFPGHETTPIVDGVPEGWEVDRADVFFDMSIGKTPPRAEKQWFTDSGQGIPWISISDMGNSGTYVFHTAEGLTAEAISKHNVKVVPADTVLVSFKLTVGRVSVTTTDMCTNEAIAHFLMPNNLLREYTYLYLKCFEYDSLGNTSAISKAVNSKIIKAMPFVMPDADTLQRFQQEVKPIFDTIRNKQLANRDLAEARDRLLPKLMNGEIVV